MQSIGTDSTPRYERWIIPVRAELLPSLPARGANGPTGRHLYLSSWFSLHRQTERKPRADPFLAADDPDLNPDFYPWDPQLALGHTIEP